ncbi:MAG TPA: ergothioneine biosynthesis protein EgtB [Cyanobacteria bacterium UBA11372]|nr:ergothioneine biosynthesis protein EgtB [Cyanobacteria bacterium UBA11372]
MNFKTNNTAPEKRQQIKQWMQQCRASTLALFEGIEYDTFCHQAHPDFSPIGWHLGHIAFTESLWLWERCAGMPSIFSQEYRRLYAADGLPKTERVKLPTIEQTCDYLDKVRSQVFEYLEMAPLDEQERLWRFILQHESQHCETIILVILVGQASRLPKVGQAGCPPHKRDISAPQIAQAGCPPHKRDISAPVDEIIEIPGGEFAMGNDSIDALDNESPRHRVDLDTYYIDRYPVTCKQYREFMQAGGYQNPKLWSDEGWKWLQENPVTKPLYWIDDSDWDNHPVCGVSWYEAEAYANFVGKRLPTEAEWEKAASWNSQTGQSSTYPWGETIPDFQLCNNNHQIWQTTPVNAYLAGKSACGCYDMLGNVWEWTATWFYGYDGFASYPYSGYSQSYFDGQHRVLKGGSWATRPWAMRCSFRNWYYPGLREILAGFRCVSY